MAEYSIQSETLTAIADAIRVKKNSHSGHTWLEYIESTGTQFIDTGYKFTSDKIRVQMEIENINDNSSCALCGSYNATDNQDDLNGLNGPTLICDARDDTLERYNFSIGASSDISTINISKNTKHTVSMEAFGNGICRVTCDSEMKTSGYKGHIDRVNNFYILAFHAYGFPLFSSGKYRLYSCQMYDNDVLVRDFIPCVNDYGSIGLYDLVNDVFYNNAGTGSFISGTEMGAIDGSTGDEDAPIPVVSMADEIMNIKKSVKQEAQGFLFGDGTYNSIYIDCGFTPDFVVIHIPDMPNSPVHCAMCAYLTNFSSEEAQLCYSCFNLNGVDVDISCHISRIETGFYVHNLVEKPQGELQKPSTRTFNYTAIKYTP